LQVLLNEKTKGRKSQFTIFDQLKSIPNKSELYNLSLYRPQDEPGVTGRVVVNVFPTRKPAISDPSFARAGHIFLSLFPLQDILRSIYRLFFFLPYRGRSTKKFFLIANSSAVIEKPVSHADTSSGRLPLSFIQCVRAYAQLSLRQRCDTSLYVKSRSYGLMLYKFLYLFKIMCFAPIYRSFMISSRSI